MQPNIVFSRPPILKFVRSACSIVCVFLSCNLYAQVDIPFEFISEEENELVLENDSLKFYNTIKGDSSRLICINDEISYYKLIVKKRVLAEGYFAMDGEKNVAEGKWIKNYDNGKLRMSGHVYKGNPVGTWQEFYTDGRLKGMFNYASIADEFGTPRSYLSGTWQQYYPDGKMKINGWYCARRMRVKDTLRVEDPVSGNDVIKIISHSGYKAEKMGKWEFYTEKGELDHIENYEAVINKSTKPEEEN